MSPTALLLSSIRGVALTLAAALVAVLLSGVGPAAAEDPAPAPTEVATPTPSEDTDPDPDPDPDPGPDPGSEPTPTPDPAPEPPPVATPPVAYSPRPGPVFNDPTGTEAERFAINAHLVQAMTNAKRGSTMRIALYSGSIPSFRDAVIAAYRRGVNVRLVMAGHKAESTWWKSMASVIGRNRSRPSWTAVCRYSCFDKRKSTLQHSKLYLFSATGTARRVVMVGSGNPTYAQANIGWNDVYTLVDDAKTYDAFVAYFEAMGRSAAKADDVDYHRASLSGHTRAVFFPSQPSRTRDYYERVLENIGCTASPGSGINGRTKVTVAMGLWSGNRVWNAKKLWELDQAGCEVEAIVSSHDLDKAVLAWLRKPGRNGGITFRAASIDVDGDGKLDRYLHEKVVMVNGGYAARQDARITFLGSHNFTYNAFRGNNDVVLSVTDPKVFQQFEARMKQLRTGTTIVPDTRSRRAVPAEVDLVQDFKNLESPAAYAE